nr:hypothetical protein B0A51_06675 [Rachicladosporium sp. CCFEE 5018]
MHLLLAAAVLATSVFAVPGSVCSKAPFKALLLPLSKNPYAQVFCTSRFPLPAVTSTIATTTLTATATASSTITIFESDLATSTVIATSTQTITATFTTTQTTTSTSTQAITTTIVTDGEGNVYRRGADPTAFHAVEERAAAALPTAHGFAKNARARSAYTACTAFTKTALPSQMSTLCSCIETPKTLLVTATSTTTSTTTKTASTTTTLTQPTTTTASSTTTSVITTSTTVPVTTTTTTTLTETFTEIATTSALVQYNACGQNFAAPDGTPVGIRCGQNRAVGQNVRSIHLTDGFSTCLFVATLDAGVTAFTFRYSDRQCVTLDGPSSANGVPDANSVYGYFYP